MSVALYRQSDHLAAVTRYAAAADRIVATFHDAVRLWRKRHEQRRTLARLTDRELRDFGISRWDAAHEAAKPFWRG